MRSKTNTQGFVLVGVVMMVLALTILGLSLFSLSSYEAQFMNRSLDSQQAMQCALGGMDRARFALAVSPDTLGMVKLWLPQDSVIWARASQHRPGLNGPDSSGPLDWNGAPVTIEVKARYRGIERSISADFTPATITNWYKRLFTIGAGGLKQNVDNGLNLSCATVTLTDSIWNYGPMVVQPLPQAAACLATSILSIGVNPRYVQTPAAATFLATHAATDIVPTLTSVALPGISGRVGYWKTDIPFVPGSYPNPDYDFSYYSNSSDVTVTVDGYAVWMLPRGLRIDGRVHIKRGTDPNACLVIVGRHGEVHNQPQYHAGVWFFSGLESQIPLILVSDDAVQIEQKGQSATTQLTQLSVFAQSVVVTGPENGTGFYLSLGYDANVMDDLIDRLMSVGAVPNSASGNPFAFRPGTWRCSP